MSDKYSSKEVALSHLMETFKLCRLAGIKIGIGRIYDSGQTMVVCVLPGVELHDGKLMLSDKPPLPA
jgi:hypothetical protein